MEKLSFFFVYFDGLIYTQGVFGRKTCWCSVFGSEVLEVLVKSFVKWCRAALEERRACWNGEDLAAQIGNSSLRVG